MTQNYDPLALRPGEISQADLTLHDSARGREIPLRLYLPAAAAPAPVVLFSHGMGGSRTGSVFLGRHWAGRGYVAVFLQHAGSDEGLWKPLPPRDRLPAMENAVTRENLVLRVQDVHAVLDQLEDWTRDPANHLGVRLDLSAVGMSGHSFGAVTTQAVSGETFSDTGRAWTDARIKAALAMSPNAPPGPAPETAFGSVSLPWMLMTGTNDIAPIGQADMESRRAVYRALSRAPKYEVVLYNAEHSVFIEGRLPGEQGQRNPNHRRVILALSTAFWDACLRRDAAALSWLQGARPREVMEPADQWQWASH